MMKPLNCPNLFVQQSLSGSTVSLKMNFFHIFFKLQGIRTTRFTWLTWHLPSVCSSFFHLFPVSQDCLFFGKKSFEVAKVTLRAVPSSSTTLMKNNLVFACVHCSNMFT